MHERPFAAFDGAVWEAGAGPVVPAARAQRLVRDPLDGTGRASRSCRGCARLEQDVSAASASGGRTRTALSITPDAVQAHGLDLRRVLSPAGTGLVWAAVAPADVLARSVPTDGNTTARRAASGDEPRRQREGQPAVHARVRHASRQRGRPCRTRASRSSTQQPDAVARNDRSRRRGDRAGAGAAPIRQRPADLSYVVTAEKDGDVAFVGSNWTGDVHPSAWSVTSIRLASPAPSCAAVSSPIAASTR